MADEPLPAPPQSLAYVLQFSLPRAESVRKLAQCGRDWIVIDTSYSGGQGGKWTAEDLGAIRSGKEGRKVLAYLSIGEAEDYRWYWRRKWDADGDGQPDKNAPHFLCDENPDWRGNYRVRYWNAVWQRIILSWLGEIISQGFDGVYLDTVDSFEFFEYDPKREDWIDNRLNPETGRTYPART
jgi:cysteinyl-tRNA synthetase, unknown class